MVSVVVREENEGREERLKNVLLTCGSHMFGSTSLPSKPATSVFLTLIIRVWTYMTQLATLGTGMCIFKVWGQG